MALIIHKR